MKKILLLVIMCLFGLSSYSNTDISYKIVAENGKMFFVAIENQNINDEAFIFGNKKINVNGLGVSLFFTNGKARVDELIGNSMLVYISPVSPMGSASLYYILSAPSITDENYPIKIPVAALLLIPILIFIIGVIIKRIVMAIISIVVAMSLLGLKGNVNFSVYIDMVKDWIQSFL